MKSLDFYRTCVPSSINCIEKVVNELICNLENNYGAIDEGTMFELRVILNEVLVNAIRHGNGEDVEKSVKVDARISGQGMVFISVEDEGSGYDYDCLCDRCKCGCDEQEPDNMNESGRGIMIVRSLCDAVKVNAKGNKIILTKNLAENR